MEVSYNHYDLSNKVQIKLKIVHPALSQNFACNQVRAKYTFIKVTVFSGVGS